MRTRRAFLGIDIGTTAVKVLLVATDGTVLANAQTSLQISVLRGGWSEQIPEDWWNATLMATRKALDYSADTVDVAGIGLSGQMHSAVVLDENNRVIRPAILWNDVRTQEQCRKIENKVGLDGLLCMVRNRALEGFTAPKILWLAQHEPKSYRRIRTILLPKDYLRLRLTGVKATEPSDASGTLLFDVASSKWSAGMLSSLNIDPEWMPTVSGSSEITGTLLPEAAKSMGLRPGIPIVGGAADNAAASLGTGVIAPGQVSVSIGTSGAVVAPVDSPQTDPKMHLHLFNHVAPKTWYLMGVVLSAGSALAWWRNILFSKVNRQPSYDDLLNDVLNIPIGSRGLTFLPYLSGERTPHSNANARGVFYGLHSGHSQADMVRAVIEGVTFAIRDSMELVSELGVKSSEIALVGGGARSKIWCQIVADVFSKTVVLNKTEGGAPYGAAMLAACGVGQYSRAKEAAETWVATGDRIKPNRSVKSQYEDAYSSYVNLYPRLQQQFAESAQQKI